MPARAFAKPETSPQTWATFIASRDTNILQQITWRQNCRLNQYRIHDIVRVAGEVPEELGPSGGMVRIESDTSIQLAEESNPAEVPIIAFHGVTQHLHYTTEVQRAELDARSHAEFEPSDETTAVLIPIGKSPQWWQLAQDSRQSYFGKAETYEGHTAIGLRYVDRVFRKLYHSRYAGRPLAYDFLTYFEFQSMHKDDFRILLNELRDTERNPEWAYTQLEYEIWMTKIG